MSNFRKIKKIKNFYIHLIYLSVFMISGIVFLGSYGSTIRDCMFILTGIVTITHIFFRKEGKFKIANNFFIWYTLFALYCMITTLWSVNSVSANTAIIHIIHAWFLGLSIYQYSVENEDINLLFDIFLFGASLASIYCIVKENIALLSWAKLGSEEFTLVGEGQTYFTCIIVWAFMIAIYRWQNAGSFKSIYIFLTMFFLLCGVLTGVRKAIFIPIIFLIIYGFTKYSKSYLKSIGYLVFAITLCIFLMYIVMRYSSSMASRITSMLYDISNSQVSSSYDSTYNSYTIRAWLRMTAFELFKKYPLFGYGIGQFKVYSVTMSGPNLYAHNNFLELLSSTGLIGFFLYYGSLFKIIFYSLKQARVGNRRFVGKYAFVASALISILCMDYGQVSYYYSMYIVFYIGITYLADWRLNIDENK